MNTPGALAEVDTEEVATPLGVALGVTVARGEPVGVGEAIGEPDGVAEALGEGLIGIVLLLPEPPPPLHAARNTIRLANARTNRFSRMYFSSQTVRPPPSDGWGWLQAMGGSFAATVAFPLAPLTKLSAGRAGRTDRLACIDRARPSAFLTAAVCHSCSLQRCQRALSCGARAAIAGRK